MKEEHGVALPCWETAQKVINGTYEMELYAAEYEANGEDWVPGRSLTPHTLFSSLSPSHNTFAFVDDDHFDGLDGYNSGK